CPFMPDLLSGCFLFPYNGVLLNGFWGKIGGKCGLKCLLHGTCTERLVDNADFGFLPHSLPSLASCYAGWTLGRPFQSVNFSANFMKPFPIVGLVCHKREVLQPP